MIFVERSIPGNYAFIYRTQGDPGCLILFIMEIIKPYNSFYNFIKNSNLSILKKKKDKLPYSKLQFSLPAFKQCVKQNSQKWYDNFHFIYAIIYNPLIHFFSLSFFTFFNFNLLFKNKKEGKILSIYLFLLNTYFFYFK